MTSSNECYVLLYELVVGEQSYQSDVPLPNSKKKSCSTCLTYIGVILLFCCIMEACQKRMLLHLQNCPALTQNKRDRGLHCQGYKEQLEHHYIVFPGGIRKYNCEFLFVNLLGLPYKSSSCHSVQGQHLELVLQSLILTCKVTI